MPTCRLIFSGLCAFVPHGGSFLEPSDPPRSITALIPNVLTPIPIELDDIIIPPHFPLLEFKLNDIAAGDTADFLRFTKALAKDEKGLLTLIQREVEIWIDGQPPTPGGL